MKDRYTYTTEDGFILHHPNGVSHRLTSTSKDTCKICWKRQARLDRIKVVFILLVIFSVLIPVIPGIVFYLVGV